MNKGNCVDELLSRYGRTTSKEVHIESGGISMTPDQIKFRDYLLKIFADQRRDMISSIIWLSKRFNKVPHDVHASYRRLSTAERNAVIREACLMGDVANGD